MISLGTGGTPSFKENSMETLDGVSKFPCGP